MKKRAAQQADYLCHQAHTIPYPSPRADYTRTNKNKGEKGKAKETGRLKKMGKATLMRPLNQWHYQRNRHKGQSIFLFNHKTRPRICAIAKILHQNSANNLNRHHTRPSTVQNQAPSKTTLRRQHTAKVDLEHQLPQRQ